MPETLILHLGLHKTVTTALQEFLAGETGALVAHGVAYPPETRRGACGALRPGARGLRPTPGGLSPGVALDLPSLTVAVSNSASRLRPFA